jgi:type IV secretory pathway VirB2 component (pilin)
VCVHTLSIVPQGAAENFSPKGKSMKTIQSLKDSRAAQILFGLTNKKNTRRAFVQAAPVFVFLTFASMAHADPVSAFFAGIQATALTVASSIAVIGIILAAAFHIFGTGRMAETMEKVGVGCFLLGGASAIAAWLFGL